MKRAPFLGASAAVLLSGCGGRHIMRALPGVAPNSVARQQPGESNPADPIPDNVLLNPIIGEARRFDGAVAPSRWMLAQGQSLDVAGNRALYSVLGTSTGSAPKGTFKLPKPNVGWIIAVAGTLPTSPAMLMSLGRHMTHRDSLGEGATIVLKTLPEKIRSVQDKRDAEVLAGRRFAQSAPRYVSRPSGPLPADAVARIERAHDDARSASFAVLSPDSRSRLDGLIGAVLGGRMSLYAAGTQMAAALTDAEARALLNAHDSTEGAFRPGWRGMDHPNPQQEAGSYVVSETLTREQRIQLSTMPQST